MSNRTKLLLVAGGFVLLIVVSLLWYFFASPAAGKVSVNIIAAPPDATITMDGQSIKTGKQFITKGTHKFYATRTYFDEINVTVDTNTLPQSGDIYLILGATSPQALQYLQDHPEVQQIREAAGGAKASAQTLSIEQKYPFITQLPYNTIDFQVNYAVDSNQNLSLQVTLNPYAKPGDPADYKQQWNDFKKEALDYLKQVGADTDKIPITYDPPTDVQPQ